MGTKVWVLPASKSTVLSWALPSLPPPVPVQKTDVVTGKEHVPSPLFSVSASCKGQVLIRGVLVTISPSGILQTFSFSRKCQERVKCFLLQNLRAAPDSGIGPGYMRLVPASTHQALPGAGRTQQRRGTRPWHAHAAARVLASGPCPAQHFLDFKYGLHPSVF